jgi:hypothetical protein
MEVALVQTHVLLQEEEPLTFAILETHWLTARLWLAVEVGEIRTVK